MDFADDDKRYYRYLFALQNSGVTNMYGACPYLEKTFPELDTQKAEVVLMYWMTHYQELYDKLRKQ